MPRERSSGSRSASIPVSARRRVVLPWSTWPAVPMTTVIDSPGQSRPNRRDEGLVVVRLNGSKIEDDAIVVDPADHGRFAASKAPEQTRGAAGAAQGETDRRDLLAGQRTTADGCVGLHDLDSHNGKGSADRSRPAPE